MPRSGLVQWPGGRGGGGGRWAPLDFTDAKGISREVTREWHAKRVTKVREKKVRAHSHLRLPHEKQTLLPVHNISW